MLVRLIPLFFPFLIFSQTNDICGVWLEEKKQSHIEIYKNQNGLYEGKIIWLAEPLDENGNINYTIDMSGKILKLNQEKRELLYKDASAYGLLKKLSRFKSFSKSLR